MPPKHTHTQFKTPVSSPGDKKKGKVKEAVYPLESLGEKVSRGLPCLWLHDCL